MVKKPLVLNYCMIHVIFGSINAFPSSNIRSPWHRFMSEKGPHSKLAQVCARHPPHHSIVLVIFGNIYKRDTEPEIYSRAAFRQRKSAPVTGCDQSLSLPLFFVPSFFTDQSKFLLSEWGGRKGPDEGCWDGRKDRGPPHTHTQTKKHRPADVLLYLCTGGGCWL